MPSLRVFGWQICSALLDASWKGPINIFEYNQPCIARTWKAKKVEIVDIHNFFVRELVGKDKLRRVYLPIEQQIVDVMTKGLAAQGSGCFGNF